MPRRGACVVSVICLLFTVSAMGRVGWLGWKTENCVLVGFGTRLFLWKYWIRLPSSVCASAFSSSSVSVVTISVVSSAYVKTLEFGTVWMMLLM